MFSEIKLNIQNNFFEDKKYTYEEYIDIGIAHLERVAKSFEKDMYACIDAKTTEKLMVQEDWFPELCIDVFLSHLWIDDGLHYAFVGWLYDTFRLRCMIDSYIWGNLRKLTDEYNCAYSNRKKKQNGNEVFDYGCGIRVSNHLISMIHIATIKMMDKAETVILLNPDEDRDIYENKTLSKRYLPWVYTEMVSAQNLRRKPLAAYRKQYIDNTKNVISDTIENISEVELEQWKDNYSYKDMCPLDILYKILNII